MRTFAIGLILSFAAHGQTFDEEFLRSCAQETAAKTKHVMSSKAIAAYCRCGLDIYKAGGTIDAASRSCAFQLRPDAQEVKDRYFSQSQVNCRWYNEIERSQRLAYITGVGDGIITGSDKDASPLLANATYDEATDGTQAVCIVPENASIRAIDAYYIFVARSKGFSDAGVSEMTAKARRYATFGDAAPERLRNPRESSKEERMAMKKVYIISLAGQGDTDTKLAVAEVLLEAALSAAPSGSLLRPKMEAGR
jgi:hypothetical protein